MMHKAKRQLREERQIKRQMLHRKRVMLSQSIEEQRSYFENFAAQILKAQNLVVTSDGGEGYIQLGKIYEKINEIFSEDLMVSFADFCIDKKLHQFFMH